VTRASTIAVPGRAQAALKVLFHWMPLVFGVLFIAPLVAQIMVSIGLPAPLGLCRLGLGFAIGAPWGLYAVLVGRWI
jgi:hypothetical protein